MPSTVNFDMLVMGVLAELCLVPGRNDTAGTMYRYFSKSSEPLLTQLCVGGPSTDWTAPQDAEVPAVLLKSAKQHPSKPTYSKF